MLIMIEGTDGVGKSTLARAVARKLRAPQVCYGPLPRWWGRRDFEYRAIHHAVYDRYHWSTAAYRLVAPQPVALSSENCWEIDVDLRRRTSGAYLTALLYSSDDAWFETRAKDDMFGVEEITRVNDWFRANVKHFDLAHDVAKSDWCSADKVLASTGVLLR